MAEPEGYVKINRNILNWGWYNNLKTCHMFIHLVIRANYKENVFMGVKIERGQLATSHRTLANETGLTVDEIRTALKHLVSTNEITITRHSKFLVITVLKYSDYQDKPNHLPINSQSLPDHFPIISQQEKESKEYKKGKERKKEVASAPDPPQEKTYPCGVSEKPEWMDEKHWIGCRLKTVKDIPGPEQGDYETYIDYEIAKHRGEVE